MSQHHPHEDRERLQDLLADRATLGLSAEESHELERLLRAHPDVDADEFDRLAAVLDLALVPPHEAMPRSLKQRVSEQARGQMGLSPARSSTDKISPAPLPVPPGAAELAASRSWLPWLATAASLLVASGAWWWALQPGRPADLAAERTELLRQRNLVVAQLDKTPAAERAEGDVVWSDAEQRGFMRLRGLPVNDPKQKQYQLWIFDKNQDERYPIDGGVFDVSANGEVIVPIRAAIRVNEPVLFAITVEKPGGVVVSKRDPIVLVGKPTT